MFAFATKELCVIPEACVTNSASATEHFEPAIIRVVLSTPKTATTALGNGQSYFGKP